MPGISVMDLFPDGGGHSRGIPTTQTPGRVYPVIPGRTLPCHRRLAVRDERHPPLHLEIWTKPAIAIHRTGTDPYAGPDCKPPKRDRQFRTATLLGAENGLSPYHLFGLPKAVSRRSRRENKPYKPYREKRLK